MEEPDRLPTLSRLESTAMQMTRELAKLVRRQTKKRRRMDRLRLFVSREQEKREGASRRSTVENGDGIEIEMILKHRDKIEMLEMRLFTEVNKEQRHIYEGEILSHMKAVREYFNIISKQWSAADATMQRLCSDGAKTAAMVRVARERIEADRGSSMIYKSDGELTDIAKELQDRMDEVNLINGNTGVEPKETEDAPEIDAEAEAG